MRKLRIIPLIKCCLLVFILIIVCIFCLCVKRFGFSTIGELGNLGYYKIEKVHRILGALTQNCFNERGDQVEIHKLHA